MVGKEPVEKGKTKFTQAKNHLCSHSPKCKDFIIHGHQLEFPGGYHRGSGDKLTLDNGLSGPILTNL